jgi:hypothetical protein
MSSGIQAGTWLVTLCPALVGPGNSFRVPYWILAEYISLPGWSTFTQLWLGRQFVVSIAKWILAHYPTHFLSLPEKFAFLSILEGFDKAKKTISR